jgi:hypothetical protein
MLIVIVWYQNNSEAFDDSLFNAEYRLSCCIESLVNHSIKEDRRENHLEIHSSELEALLPIGLLN